MRCGCVVWQGNSFLYFYFLSFIIFIFISYSPFLIPFSPCPRAGGGSKSGNGWSVRGGGVGEGRKNCFYLLDTPHLTLPHSIRLACFSDEIWGSGSPYLPGTYLLTYHLPNPSTYRTRLVHTVAKPSPLYTNTNNLYLSTYRVPEYLLYSTAPAFLPPPCGECAEEASLRSRSIGVERWGRRPALHRR